MITPQQAATLLEQGQITPDQYRQIVGQTPPAQSPAINNVLAGAGLKPPAAPPPAPASPLALQLTPGAGLPAPMAPLGAGAPPPAAPALPPIPNAAALAQATGTVPDPSRVRPSEAVDLALREPVGTTARAARPLEAAASPAAAGGGPVPIATPGLIPYPEGGTRPHAVGNTPSERAQVDDLKKRAEMQVRATDSATAALNEFQDTFKRDTERNADDAAIERMLHEKRLRDEDEHRTAIATEYKQSQERIAAQIAKLEQEGIDPKAYFKKLGTGGSILAGIAAAMGAFGAHPLGPHGTASPNFALDIINRGISDEIDAQKTNLSKTLSALGKRMDLGKEGFDHGMALLKSERDSTESAYQVAMNEIDRRRAMYKDNADLQTRLQQLRDQVFQSGQDRVGALNDQIFQIRRHGEQVVGGQPDKTAAIIKRVAELRDKAAANGKDLSVEEAQRQAIEEIAGVNMRPGATDASIAKEPKGDATKKTAADWSDAEEGLRKLIALREKHGGGALFSAEDRAQAQALSVDTRTAMAHARGRVTPAEVNILQSLVPENPLELNASGVLGADPTMTRLRTALSRVQAHKASAAGGAEPDTSPEALGGQRDE